MAIPPTCRNYCLYYINPCIRPSMTCPNFMARFHSCQRKRAPHCSCAYKRSILEYSNAYFCCEKLESLNETPKLQSEDRGTLTQNCPRNVALCDTGVGPWIHIGVQTVVTCECETESNFPGTPEPKSDDESFSMNSPAPTVATSVADLPLFDDDSIKCLCSEESFGFRPPPNSAISESRSTSRTEVATPQSPTKSAHNQTDSSEKRTVAITATRCKCPTVSIGVEVAVLTIPKSVYCNSLKPQPRITKRNCGVNPADCWPSIEKELTKSCQKNNCTLSTQWSESSSKRPEKAEKEVCCCVCDACKARNRGQEKESSSKSKTSKKSESRKRPDTTGSKIPASKSRGKISRSKNAKKGLEAKLSPCNVCPSCIRRQIENASALEVSEASSDSLEKSRSTKSPKPEKAPPSRSPSKTDKEEKGISVDITSKQPQSQKQKKAESSTPTWSDTAIYKGETIICPPCVEPSVCQENEPRGTRISIAPAREGAPVASIYISFSEPAVTSYPRVSCSLPPERLGEEPTSQEPDVSVPFSPLPESLESKEPSQSKDDLVSQPPAEHSVSASQTAPERSSFRKSQTISVKSASTTTSYVSPSQGLPDAKPSLLEKSGSPSNLKSSSSSLKKLLTSHENVIEESASTRRSSVPQPRPSSLPSSSIPQAETSICKCLCKYISDLQRRNPDCGKVSKGSCLSKTLNRCVLDLLGTLTECPGCSQSKSPMGPAVVRPDEREYHRQGQGSLENLGQTQQVGLSEKTCGTCVIKPGEAVLISYFKTGVPESKEEEGGAPTRER